MLILNPRSVTFAGVAYPDVLAVTIDRTAKRLALEWSDLGPHLAFADVPEQLVAVKIVQEVVQGGPDAPRPGESGTLSLSTSTTGADGGRLRLSASAVVTGCTHEIVTSGRAIGARRTIELVLVSATGAADPVTIASAGPMGGEP